jgi:hypothetical protein
MTDIVIIPLLLCDSHYQSDSGPHSLVSAGQIEDWSLL